MHSSNPSVGALWRATTARLEGLGAWFAPLGLRLILAWEFGEAGFEKLRGQNWFGHVQDKLPFPFNHAPTELSWFLATWFEVIGAFALVVGLFTRFIAFSLLGLTFVAVAAVHWPDSFGTMGELWKGYAIRDEGFGNFKLPLLFALMLLPLVLSGPGKLSVDHLLAQWLLPAEQRAIADGLAWAWGGIGFGLLLATLFPTVGLSLAAAGAIGAGMILWRARHSRLQHG